MKRAIYTVGWYLLTYIMCNSEILDSILTVKLIFFVQRKIFFCLVLSIFIRYLPFRLVSNGQRWSFNTSDVTWSQKFTLVYTLNPELTHRSTITDVLVY